MPLGKATWHDTPLLNGDRIEQHAHHFGVAKYGPVQHLAESNGAAPGHLVVGTNLVVLNVVRPGVPVGAVCR